MRLSFFNERMEEMERTWGIESGRTLRIPAGATSVTISDGPPHEPVEEEAKATVNSDELARWKQKKVIIATAKHVDVEVGDVKIDLTGPNDGHVFFDGVEQLGISDIYLDAPMGENPRVRITKVIDITNEGRKKKLSADGARLDEPKARPSASPRGEQAD